MASATYGLIASVMSNLNNQLNPQERRIEFDLVQGLMNVCVALQADLTRMEQKLEKLEASIQTGK
jgi:hypothetical protein